MGASEPLSSHPPLSRPDDPLQPPPLYTGAQYNSMAASTGVPTDPLIAPPASSGVSTYPGAMVSSVIPYQPVRWHWFFSRIDGIFTVWRPFTAFDSSRLENAWMANRLSENIATDGGRYDVRLSERRRYPVYWEEKPAEVRRCSWFFR